MKTPLEFAMAYYEATDKIGLIEARDAEWRALVEQAREALYEAMRIAHSYTDGIASKEAASVAHGIGARIEAFIAKAEGKTP